MWGKKKKKKSLSEEDILEAKKEWLAKKEKRLEGWKAAEANEENE